MVLLVSAITAFLGPADVNGVSGSCQARPLVLAAVDVAEHGPAGRSCRPPEAGVIEEEGLFPAVRATGAFPDGGDLPLGVTAGPGTRPAGHPVTRLGCPVDVVDVTTRLEGDQEAACVTLQSVHAAPSSPPDRSG
jgi:hypothetical protein